MAKRSTDKDSSGLAVARKAIGYTYVGDGAHIPGVPRRDLTASDLVRFRVAVAEHEGSETFKALYAPVYEKDGDEVNDA